MRTAQYVRQEKAIAAAETSTIRERWLWGLRVLRDQSAMTESGKSLRHGVTDQLIAAAEAAGYQLSATEIRYRIQCARTYPTDVEIATVCGDFATWSDLREAGFPPALADGDEPPADHRTPAERDRDARRRFAELAGEQGALFPLDELDPAEATLKQLEEYTTGQHEITARFVAVDERRRAYVDQLVAAAGGDLSVTWAAAQALLAGREDPS